MRQLKRSGNAIYNLRHKLSDQLLRDGRGITFRLARLHQTECIFIVVDHLEMLCRNARNELLNGIRISSTSIELPSSLYIATSWKLLNHEEFTEEWSKTH